jgi:hypothetical protein
MNFEWFHGKAESNVEKHDGVSFEEAQTVFDDPMQYHYPDDPHSIEEQRFICLGMSSRGKALTVVYTEDTPENIRIISAREMTAREERIYATHRDDN